MGINIRVIRNRRALVNNDLAPIVEEARWSQADIVVLRAPCSGRRWRMFGKTVDHVLKHGPCRVMVDALPPRP